MLMNELDTTVAEPPDDPVVDGGSGMATRETVRDLENRDGRVAEGRWIWVETQAISQETDETFAAARNGAAARVIEADPRRLPRRHATGCSDEATANLDEAPGTVDGWRRRRVARSMGSDVHAADASLGIRHRGVLPDVVTDGTSTQEALNEYVRRGGSRAEAAIPRTHQPESCVARSMASTARHVAGMIALPARGAMTFDDGSTIDARARRASAENAFDIPGCVPEHVRPHFCECDGLFRWAALSKDPDDIRVTDDTVLKMFADAPLCRWNRLARERITCQARRARADLPGRRRGTLMQGPWRQSPRQNREASESRCAGRRRTH